jgi:gas vesicle protein
MPEGQPTDEVLMTDNPDTQLLLAGLISGAAVGALAALLWRQRSASAAAELPPARGLTLSLPSADGVERARRAAEDAARAAASVRPS